MDHFGGTETIARYVENNIINDCPSLKKVQWFIIPGHIFNVDLDKFTIVWSHLPSSDIVKDHYMYGQFFMDKDIVEKINIYLTQSNWHKQDLHQAFSIPLEKIYVIPNGINTKELYSNQKEKIKLLYTSDCKRGLKILNKSIKYIKNKDFEINIKGCSCNKCFNFLNKMNKKINVTGYLIREEYLNQLATNNILAYPCTWNETFCIVAAEALSSGMKVITTDSGALEETTNGFATIVKKPKGIFKNYRFAKKFGKQLSVEISNYKNFNSSEQIKIINSLYSWEKVKENWITFDSFVKNKINGVN
jgi:glycosyltransferase involved in cell wall biosynthesis